MSKKSVIGHIFSSLKPYFGLLLLSLVCSVLQVMCSLYIPILVGNGVDLIVSEGNVDFNSLFVILIKICAFFISASVFQYLMSVLNNKITYLFTRDLKNDFFVKIQNLSISYLDKHSYGDILSRMVNDIEVLSDGLLLGFNQLFSGVVIIVVTLIFMFMMNYVMALVVLFLTPISLFVAKFVAKNIHRYFKDQAIIKSEQTSFIDEIINGQKVIRAFAKEDDNQVKFDEISVRLEKVALKANFYSALVNPTTRFVNAIVYAIVCLIGAVICINNPLFTAGKLTTFLSYANQYTKPFNDISSVITELQNAFTSAERVFVLLDEEEIKNGGESLGSVEGNVELKNVYFSYEKSQRLIEDFSIKVSKGQKIAIVGPTGCGKTTLINLLMRFYDINKGCIMIDGKDVSMFTRDSVRENIGMVLQETYLRHASIRENILMGSEISEEELIRISKESHIDYFVSRLPNGFDTVIDENYGLLSQGQKQLLCIARVMVNLPPMLILDEATSSIDTRTEIKIQEAFNKMMKGRTTFIVAHRLSTIQGADKIIVMNEGHIIEQGNHHELLKNKGFYYNLYNSQFES